jgi:hypothetical protein
LQPVQVGRGAVLPVRSLIGLAIVTAIVTAISIIIIAAAYLLFYSVFVDASDTAKGVVAASISVFVWVILWDPMEKLLFEWGGPRMENNILRKLKDINIVVRPKSYAAPLGLPDFLRAVLIVLALYVCSVLSCDAVWSLAFDWVPYV